MPIEFEKPYSHPTGVQGRDRILYLFAASLSIALTAWTMIVHLPAILPSMAREMPPFAIDLTILGFCGCAILMATRHILRDRLSLAQRNGALIIAGSGMLILPLSLALWLA